MAERDDGAERFLEHDLLFPYTAGYAVERVLERRRTPYQDLLVFESRGFGRVLTLDNVVQLTQLDTFVYHELLAHPALFAHPQPRRLGIIGGGDGHLLIEALKHESVERVTVMELDGEVIEACRRHFPGVDAAFSDPRVEIRTGDAVASITEMSDLDVILCDSTDPVGQAARLFDSSFYGLCAAALGPAGIFVAQTESIHFNAPTVRACRRTLAEHFPDVAVLQGTIATYPGAWWTFTVASRAGDPTLVRRRQEIDTRLYRPDLHSWFFFPQEVLDRLLA